jgi:basic membrane protein A
VRRPLVALFAALTLVALSGSEANAAKQYRVVFLEGPDPAYRIALQHVAGMRRAVRDFEVAGQVVHLPIRMSPASTLRTLARRNDLVITGGDMGGFVADVAKSSPDTRFVVAETRAEWWGLSSWPDNVAGVVTRDEEIGFVVGYLAGLVERGRPGPDVVGSVGGIKVPPVDSLIAGYQAGARRASPGIRTLNDYSNDFADPGNCRPVAAAQIAKGAGVVFNVAGGCGLGTLAAARAARVWAIGVDQDQSALGPHILTSAVKRFDVRVHSLVEQLVEGRLQTGRDTSLGLREGVLDLGKVSRQVSRRTLEQVLAIQRRIESGRLQGIPTTVP